MLRDGEGADRSRRPHALVRDFVAAAREQPFGHRYTSMSRCFKLTLAYDGHDFAGWQLQATARTVQGVVEEALHTLEGSRVVVTAAGRTDAGVHAVGQVVSFTLTGLRAPDVVLRALNAMLPEDVRAMQIEEVSSEFNARRLAQRKTYHYLVWNGPIMPPLVRRQCWRVPHPLDVDAMNEAAAHLVGSHDFSAFQAAGAEMTRTRRTIVLSRWHTVPFADAAVGLMVSGADTIGARALQYEVSGSGFLRHMVRAIVGTLVEVGRHRLAPGALAEILASRHRGSAGPNAPAKGLTLWRVEY